MRSQAFAFAVSMIASAGKFLTCNVSHSMPIVSASARTSPRIFAADAVVAFSYSRGKLAAMVSTLTLVGKVRWLSSRRLAPQFFCQFQASADSLARDLRSIRGNENMLEHWLTPAATRDRRSRRTISVCRLSSMRSPRPGGKRAGVCKLCRLVRRGPFRRPRFECLPALLTWSPRFVAHASRRPLGALLSRRLEAGA
jgi:hypothetical protein